jgi:hypothetical protein
VESGCFIYLFIVKKECGGIKCSFGLSVWEKKN